MAVFFVAWLLALVAVPESASVLSDYFPFTFLGVVGAIFANSTGAGGGVVFIPMFNQLGFVEGQAVATSFAIQSFGMTAGALTWSYYYHHEKRHLQHWFVFKKICALVAACSVLGVWLVYGAQWASPASLKASFSLFSIVLGGSLLLSILRKRQEDITDYLTRFDYLAMVVIGFFGGIITAWLSVGVGEILALYLIFRGFSVTMAVASAVVVSALTVWAAIPQHVLIEPQVYWQVLLFAGPGAAAGGVFAKTLAVCLPPRTLKLFFAVWALIMGLSTSTLLPPLLAYARALLF